MTCPHQAIAVNMTSVDFLQWDREVLRLKDKNLLHLLPGISQEITCCVGGAWALLQHDVQPKWCTSSIPVGAAKRIEEEVEAGHLTKLPNA